MTTLELMRTQEYRKQAMTLRIIHKYKTNLKIFATALAVYVILALAISYLILRILISLKKPKFLKRGFMSATKPIPRQDNKSK